MIDNENRCRPPTCTISTLVRPAFLRKSCQRDLSPTASEGGKQGYVKVVERFLAVSFLVRCCVPKFYRCAELDASRIS